MSSFDISPELAAGLGVVLTAFAALLTAIAAYVRNAAVALQQRNIGLDALAVAADATKELQAKQAKDLAEAWGRIRSLEGALGVLTSGVAPTKGSTDG